MRLKTLTNRGPKTRSSNPENLVWRLPRARDQDLIRFLKLQEDKDGQAIAVSQMGLAQIFNITQPAVSALLRQVYERLKIIERNSGLQVEESAKRDLIKRLRAADFTRSDATYLWWLFWTTSPAEARRRAKLQRPSRVVGKFLDRRFDDPNLRGLQDGLRCVRNKGWGCLWGRQGRRSRPGSEGNRAREVAVSR